MSSSHEIADRLEIQHRIDLYVHSLDSGDLESMNQVFSADVVFDYRSIGLATMNCSDPKEWLKQLPSAAVEQHIYANTLISLSDDHTQAVSLSQAFNPQGMVGTDGLVHYFGTHGVYRDEWAKSAEGWRIRRRAWTRPFYAGAVPPELPQPVDHS